MKHTTLRQEILYFLCKCGLIANNRNWNEDAFAVINYDEITKVDKKNSSSNILIVKKQNDVYYFRECGANYPQKKSLAKILQRYGELSDSPNFMDYIQKCLSIPHNRKLFWRMGQLNDRNSALYRFYETKNSSIVGLPDKYNIYQQDIIKFLSYAWSEIMICRYNQGGGNYRLFGYNRAKSQYIVARHLGIEDLICPINLRKIKKDGQIIFGSLMPKAQGIDPNSLNEYDLTNCISPRLLCSLISLNILDAICMEKDHRPGNYNIILDGKGRGVSVVAFDNDSPFCFFPTIKSNMTSYFGSSNIINSYGGINRVGIDAVLADKIINIDLSVLLSDLKPYLNYIQRYTLKRRIINIQRAIIKSISKNKYFTKNKGDWTNEDVVEDLSGKYGRTYLSILKNWKKMYGDYSVQKQVFINDI